MEKAGGETTVRREQAFLTSGKLSDHKVKQNFSLPGVKRKTQALCARLFLGVLSKLSTLKLYLLWFVSACPFNSQN